MASKDRKIALWHPSLWPAWLVVGVFRLLYLLPWGCQMGLGRLLGRLAGQVLRIRRHVVDVNLHLCFPDMLENERRQLAIAHYEAIGMGLFETITAWWTPRGRFRQKFIITGVENLDAAKAHGKGVLLLTAHFTTLEICGRFFCDNMTMGGLYREPDNRVMARQMIRGRISKLEPAVPMDDLRGLLRALRAGSTMWYAPDQGKKGKFASVLPFFGVPALTNTATSRIAQMSGAAVVPYFGLRMPDGSYRLEILPALENFPTDDVEADALRITRLMEEHILKAPEQYFWIHRKFKRRGEEYPDPYR